MSKDLKRWLWEGFLTVVVAGVGATGFLFSWSCQGDHTLEPRVKSLTLQLNLMRGLHKVV